jgi:hypothetical protein
MLEFRTSRCSEVNNIEKGFKEIVRENVDRINLHYRGLHPVAAKDRGQRHALMNTAMNLWLHKMMRIS